MSINRMTYRIALFFLLFFRFFQPCFCQHQVIRGIVADSLDGKVISLATVAVYRANDSSLLHFQLTNNSGEFKVSRMPNDPVFLVISCTGYKVYCMTFDQKEMAKEVNIGSVYLAKDTGLLKEVLVYSLPAPVLVKDGMIEFFAPAFQIPPNSLVEDLFRKMPGIEVDKSGMIFFNGRKVNRITIDGKSFYGGNTNVASQNLPAEMIAKVQVILDKEELERNPDADIQQIGHVINLVLKNGARNKWVGRLYSGAGSHERFELGGFGNLIKEKVQVGLIGVHNNVNKHTIAIRDLQGLSAFGKGGLPFYAMEGKTQSHLLQLNLLPYFESDAGISRFAGSGINLNLSPHSKFNSYLQYLFGNKLSTVENAVISRQFIGDTTLTTNSRSGSSGNANTHSFNFGSFFRLNDRTDLRIRVNYSLAIISEHQDNFINAQSNQNGELSSLNGDQHDRLKYHDLSQDATLSLRSTSKEGRRLTFFESITHSKGRGNKITNYLTEFFFPLSDTILFNQLQVRNSPATTVLTSVVYSEPLSKEFVLRTGVNNSQEIEKRDISTYKNGQSGNFDSVVNDLTIKSRRYSNRLSPFGSFFYSKGQINYNIGANFLYQYVNFRYGESYTNIKRYFPVLPFFKFNWKHYQFSYSRELVLPLQEYLTPIPDSSNPFSLKLGNPFLDASRQDKIHFSSFKFISSKSLYYSLSAGINFVKGDVAISRSIDAQGVQTSLPVNVNGSQILFINGNIRREFRKSKGLVYTFNAGGNLTYNSRKIIINSTTGRQKYFSIQPRAGFDISKTNKFDLRFTYDYKRNAANYTTSSFKDTRIHEGKFEMVAVLYITQNVFFENNLSYQSLRTDSRSGKSEILLNNSSLSFLAFQKKAQLKLLLFDVFKKNNNISQMNMQNFLTTIEQNVLTRFVMLSCIYNFRIGKEQANARKSF